MDPHDFPESSQMCGWYARSSFGIAPPVQPRVKPGIKSNIKPNVKPNVKPHVKPSVKPNVKTAKRQYRKTEMARPNRHNESGVGTTSMSCPD